MLKAIHAQESCEAARRKAAEVIAKLRAMRTTPSRRSTGGAYAPTTRSSA
jgi:hypothetical protein